MAVFTPKTKIVCTIGPASESYDAICDLIRAGMGIARLNFSHGTHAEHKKKIQRLRRASGELGRPIAILQDLGGPKIRIGRIAEPGVRLETGSCFVLTSRKVPGGKDRVSVSYPDLPKEVTPGERILLADGLMELRVESILGTDILCRVVTGGVLSSRKGINLPMGTIKAPSLTKKDLRDLNFGLAQGVDYIALSFVRTAKDVQSVRQVVRDRGKDIPIIAKIEKHEALNETDSIIEASDGIMVARGDLGVEIPLSEVPLIQKTLIRRANEMGRPVITATQMLRSMVDSPRPTRAEATDVANAVLDGTDAVMLSEETASGGYPIEAVRYMAQILERAETRFPHGKYLNMMPRKNVAESVAHVSCVLADHLDAAAIIAPTQSGKTAQHISRFRPKRTIVALSKRPEVVRRLSLYWGCMPLLLEEGGGTEDMFEKAAQSAVASGGVDEGDLVVVTAGYPSWVAGTTNMLRVMRLRDEKTR